MTTMRVFLATLLCLAALSSRAGDWKMLDDSTLSFATTFEGEPLPGRFDRFDVMFDFDPETPVSGKLRVTVDLGGANMGDVDMNEAIAGAEWFDVKTFPQAVFESDHIVATSPGHFVASGALSLKGSRRDVEVPFTWLAAGDSAEMRGDFQLKRSDFDVGSGEWSSGEQIGIDVKLQFAVKLQRLE
jgi:polyisoprenoid-binding protein YceI